MLYGNNIYFSECVFYSNFRYVEFVCRFFIEGMCIVTLAPAVMTINGSTFQPL